MKFDGMRNKVVSSLELEKNVVLKSRLTDPAGALLQEFELKSEKVRYAQGDTPNLKGRLVVPLPGQMLIRDYRSTATRVRTNRPTVEAQPRSSGQKT